MPAAGQRRSHTKSKKGCSQCKTRRIKVSPMRPHAVLCTDNASVMSVIRFAATVNAARSSVISLATLDGTGVVHQASHRTMTPPAANLKSFML